MTIRPCAVGASWYSMGVGRAGALGEGGTGTTIWEDRSTIVEVRRPFSMTTGIGGVTVGGESAGVGKSSTTAGAGAAGAGISTFPSRGTRCDPPNRPK